MVPFRRLFVSALRSCPRPSRASAARGGGAMSFVAVEMQRSRTVATATGSAVGPTTSMFFGSRRGRMLGTAGLAAAASLGALSLRHAVIDPHAGDAPADGAPRGWFASFVAAILPHAPMVASSALSDDDDADDDERGADADAQRKAALLLSGKTKFDPTVLSPTAHLRPSGFVHVVLVIARAFQLAINFTPVIIVYVASRLYAPLEDTFARILIHTMQSNGAALIKFGQWAASRSDLFGQLLCDRFAFLHARAPAHSTETTMRTIEQALGREKLERLEGLSSEPLGSGCVAQVHQAWLRFSEEEARVIDQEHYHEKLQWRVEENEDGTRDRLTPVVVKVIHPGVRPLIERDVELMIFFAHLLEMLPGGKWLSFVDAAHQFREVLVSQLDLTVEARSLQRFRRNFATNKHLVFPRPFESFLASEVIVESFEEGELVEHFLKRPATTKQEDAVRKKVAAIGFQAFLQMAVMDNFVHGDLHPGNMIVRGTGAAETVQAVVLDAGIVIALAPSDRRNFVTLFAAVAKTDGRKAAYLMVDNAREHECPDRDAFADDVQCVVDDVDQRTLSLGDVSVGEILMRMLSLAREHRVKIDGMYSSLAVAMGLAEGIGRQLDPSVDLLKLAVPWLVRLSLEMRLGKRDEGFVLTM